MNNLEISLLFLFILFLILFYISNFVYNKYLIDPTQEPFSGHLKQSDLDAAIAEKQRIQQKLQGLENDLTTFTNQVKLFKDKSEGNKAALTELDEYRKMYYGEFNNQINLIRGLLNSQNSNLGGITNSYLTNMATFETFTDNQVPAQVPAPDAEFDCAAYGKRYPDVKNDNWYGRNCDTLKQHYDDYGKDEGRNPRSFPRYATKVYVGNSNTNPKIITLEDQGIDEVQTNYINKWAGRQCHGTNSCGVGDNFNTEIFTDTDGLKKLKVTRLDNDSGWGMRLELPAKTTNRPIGPNDNVYDFDQKLQILQETDAENQEKLDTLTARINGVNDLITTLDPNDKNVYSPVPASYQQDDTQQDDTQQDDTQQFEYTPTNTQPLPPVIVDHSQKQLSANARAAIQNASADDARYAAELAAQEDRRKVELYDQITNAWNTADYTSVPRRKGYSPSHSNNNINNYDHYVKNTNAGNFITNDNDNIYLRETNSGYNKLPQKWNDDQWKSVFRTNLPQYSDKLPSNFDDIKNNSGHTKRWNTGTYPNRLYGGYLTDGAIQGRMDGYWKREAVRMNNKYGTGLDYELGRGSHDLRVKHQHYKRKFNLPNKYDCNTRHYLAAVPERPNYPGSSASQEDILEYQRKLSIYNGYRANHQNNNFRFSHDMTYGTQKEYDLCKSQ